MIKIILFFLLSLTINAYSCEETLLNKIKSGNDIKNALRECLIQDRFHKIQIIFNDHNLNLDDVTEYRSLRLIDRSSWERNIKRGNYSPQWVYDPMPTTWEVWNNGIKLIFNDPERISDNILDKENIIYINKVLLSRGKIDISNQMQKPGKLRKSIFGLPVGFCSTDKKINLKRMFVDLKKASQTYMKEWEKKAKISLIDLIIKHNGRSAKKANLALGMRLSYSSCTSNENANFVEYISPSKVKRSLSWLGIFLNYNYQQYLTGNLILPPIELATIVQKLFVTIHPFTDGNGRTSRAIQNIILKRMNMPFAPGGDLQNDVLEYPNKYIQKTYSKIESMLSLLEICSNELITNSLQSKRCQPYNMYK